MPFRKLFFFPLSLAGLIGACLADTVVLKNGRSFTGEVISSDPEKVVIEYFVTPTIKDEKTISREDIARLSIIPEEEKSFLALGTRISPPTVQDTTFYDTLIERKIPAFIQKYPFSPHIAELRKNLESLTMERSRVIRGDRRIDGVWITAEEIAEDPYQTTAKIKFNEIRERNANNDPVAGLKAYELMELKYPGARVYPDALDLTSSLLNQLQGKLATAMSNFTILDKQRTLTIESATVDEAKDIKDGLDNENHEAQILMTKALADGSKFFPVFPNSKEALESLQALIVSERARLDALRKIPMRESLAASEESGRLLAQGDIKGAQEQMDSALKLWPANVEIATLKQKIDAAAKAAQTNETARAAAEAAMPKSTPLGNPTKKP